NWRFSSGRNWLFSPGRKWLISPDSNIEGKIAKKQAEIAELEAQKQSLLHPVTMKAVMAKAKEAGLSPKEIAEKLGIEL
uniref:hypothetical protein n=1 Tax=uncultured Dysosmobacter sp. TaxID=2591384 RepID=UPI00262AE172